MISLLILQKNFFMDSQRHWFVLKTKYRCEKKLYQQLQNDGYEVCLPMYSTVRQWSDRKKKLQLPLINCMVFIKTNTKELYKIYDYPLVRGVLKEFGKPGIVRDQEIKNLEIIANDWSNDLIEKNTNLKFKKGELIEIVYGPFKGLIGDLIQIDGTNRVIVQIESIGIDFIINISKSQIRKST